MPGPFEQIGTHRIYLNDMYYLAYAGGSRELPEKQQKEYQKAKNMPFILQVKEINKIPLKNNPTVIPLSGRDLLGFIKELKFMPFFDHFFKYTHKLQLTDLIVYESIRQKSYNVAMNK